MILHVVICAALAPGYYGPPDCRREERELYGATPLQCLMGLDAQSPVHLLRGERVVWWRCAQG